MRYIYILFMLGYLGCSSPQILLKRHLTKVYHIQKEYYQNVIADDNYISIINIAAKTRTQLLQHYHIQLDTVQQYLFLESFSPGSGSYQALIWNAHFAYFYKRYSSDSTIIMQKQDIADGNWKNQMPINAELIDILDRWDMDKIRQLNEVFANHPVHSCFFIATKVEKIDKRRSKIELVHFEEFSNYDLQR